MSADFKDRVSIKLEGIFPASRARIGMHTYPRTKNTIEIALGASRFLLFYKDHPIAAYSGHCIYFHCEPGPEQKAVNGWSPRGEAKRAEGGNFGIASIRCDAPGFDFVVGQILTTAGLPLTMREG